MCSTLLLGFSLDDVMSKPTPTFDAFLKMLKRARTSTTWAEQVYDVLGQLEHYGSHGPGNTVRFVNMGLGKLKKATWLFRAARDDIRLVRFAHDEVLVASRRYADYVATHPGPLGHDKEYLHLRGKLGWVWREHYRNQRRTFDDLLHATFGSGNLQKARVDRAWRYFVDMERAMLTKGRGQYIEKLRAKHQRTRAARRAA